MLNGDRYRLGRFCLSTETHGLSPRKHVDVSTKNPLDSVEGISMSTYFEFLILLFMFGIATRVLFQIWKSFRQENYIAKRRDIWGPILAAAVIMTSIRFKFNVFDYFSLDVPFATGIIITILIVSQVSWETHDVIRWFSARLWGGIFNFIGLRNALQNRHSSPSSARQKAEDSIDDDEKEKKS